MQKPYISSLILASTLILGACGGSSSGNSQNSVSSSSPVSSAPVSSTPATSSESSSSSSATTVSLHTLADFPIGVAVSVADWEISGIFDDDAEGVAQRAVIEQHFSQLTAGNIMKMSYLHPNRGTFTFDQADRLLNYAEDNGITLHGHTLVWHPDYQVPAWMMTFDGDRAEWFEILKEHVTGVASHYAGRVPSWDVVNEAFEEDGSYRNSLFFRKMDKDYVETAFIAARAADPEADLYYNDFNLSNGGAKFTGMLAMVDDFLARDIPIDGVGFQMHIFVDWPSIADIKNSFKAVADRGLKVKITELDIPLNNPYSDAYDFPDSYHTSLTGELAAAQKKRYCEVVAAYIDAVPEAQRGGLTVWGVHDSDSWLIRDLFKNNHQDWPLLFDNDYNPKPAFDGVADGLTGRPCL